MRRGVDFSEWGGPLAAETVVAWKGLGIRFAIVQYSRRMTQHLEVLAQVGGLDVEAYVYLYWVQDQWGQTPQQRTRNALNLLQGSSVRRLWLDCEDSEQPFDEAQLWECVTICNQAGIQPGIYTGRWWWVPRASNSQLFAELPLWHAEYVDVPDFDSFVPYGGWTRPTIWQYQGTTTLAGHSVDLIVMEEVSPVSVNLNADGSKRIEAQVMEDGREYIVIVNDNVPVLRIGGDLPGRLAKNYGGNWLYLRQILDDGVSWAPGTFFSATPGD